MIRLSRIRILHLVLLQLALTGLITQAQTSVTLDPVGAMVLTFQGSSDTAFSLPFTKPPVFTGVVGSLDGSLGLSPSSTPGWTANQFLEQPHYLVFKSGLMEGMYYTIVGNSASSLTLENIGAGTLFEQGISPSDAFDVIPYWTLSTVFPGGDGLHASSDVFNPKSVVLFRNDAAGANRAFGSSYFYHDGSQLPAGWYQLGNLGGGLQDDVAFPPDESFALRHPPQRTGAQLSNTTLIISGSVPMRRSKTIVSRVAENTAQDNYISSVAPVDMTLSELALNLSPSFEVSNDVFNPKDVLLLFNNDIAATNKAFGSSYFYHNGAQLPEGWYRLGKLGDGLQDSNKILKAGEGFVIRKSPQGTASSEILSIKPPYID